LTGHRKLVLRCEARADLKQRLAIAVGQLVEDHSPSRIGQRLEDIADAGLYASKRLHVKFGSISLAITSEHRRALLSWKQHAVPPCRSPTKAHQSRRAAACGFRRAGEQSNAPELGHLVPGRSTR
jgi:hypothetical protein